MVANDSLQSGIGTLITTFLIGAAVGTLIKTAVRSLLHTYGEARQRQRKEIQELQAIQAHEEQPDQVEDDRITCPHCWENRHPGQLWPLRSYIPCFEHTSEKPGAAEEDHHRKEAALHR